MNKNSKKKLKENRRIWTSFYKQNCNIQGKFVKIIVKIKIKNFFKKPDIIKVVNFFQKLKNKF